MPDLVLDLERTLDQPARARAFVAGHLDRYSHDTHADTRADALLLVSELVSNVVQHGALPARMLLQLTTGRLHVLVEDSGADVPEGPGRANVDAPNGRGLIIVASIATAWGISTVAGQAGKGIWFDLAILP